MNNQQIIGSRYISHGNVFLGNGVIIGNNVTIGYPKEARIQEYQRSGVFNSNFLSCFDEVEPTSIGENCLILSNVIIYEGTKIGNNVFIEDGCRIGFNCIVGDSSRIIYSAFVCDRITIGSSCVIGGFVCDGADIGEDSIILGSVVHELSNPHLSWGIIEPAPILERRVVVGMNATVVGGIKIGENSYIAAGATVTKNVPPNSIVTGENKITPLSEWKGRKLSKDLIIYRGRTYE